MVGLVFGRFEVVGLLFGFEVQLLVLPVLDTLQLMVMMRVELGLLVVPCMPLSAGPADVGAFPLGHDLQPAGVSLLVGFQPSGLQLFPLLSALFP